MCRALAEGGAIDSGESKAGSSVGYAIRRLSRELPDLFEKGGVCNAPAAFTGWRRRDRWAGATRS